MTAVLLVCLVWLPAAARANHAGGNPVIPLGGTISEEFVNGHADVKYFCSGPNRWASQVVFAYVTGTGKRMTVASHYATTDVVMFVWKNTAGFPLVGCSDDVEGGNGRNGRVIFASESGQSYLVGIGKLCSGDCTATPPDTTGKTYFDAFDNDTRGTARSSAFGVAFNWTNAGAEDGNEDATDCRGTVIDDGVWFRYGATSHGTATFHLTSQLGRLALHAYKPDGSLIGCDMWTSGTTSLKIGASAGPGDWLVQVGAVRGATFDYGGTDFTLHAEFTPDYDLDDDGVNGTPGEDCNDGNAAIRPGLPEIVNNEVDENCDGIREFDGDGDQARVFKDATGQLVGRAGADCDDGDPARAPGRAELVGNGKDEDCDGRDTPFPRIGSTVLHTFAVYARSGYMVATRLKVTGVVAGATVEIRCARRAGGKRPKRGMGCPFRRKVVTRSARTRTLNLVRYLARRKLARELNIDVSVKKAGMVGRTKRMWLPRRGTSVRSQYACLDAVTGRRLRCS